MNDIRIEVYGWRDGGKFIYEEVSSELMEKINDLIFKEIENNGKLVISFSE